MKLAVRGDFVYGDVHQMLEEANTKGKRACWIASIRKVEALKPKLLVGGHKRASEMDCTYHLTETRKYIENFDQLIAGGARNARELSKAMLEWYPARSNQGALLIGCINAFKQERTKL